ncbi:MAG: type IV secretion system DNA-binding domain-containing protein [Patescibacteria group bacterium]
MSDVTPIGTIQFREREIKFGVKRDDRRRHMYVIGKTGSGKTTLLENLIINDIKTKEGIGYMDPHGDSVKRILKYIPKERIQDVIYFNPADTNHPISFNPLEGVSWDYRHLVASSILSVFKKIWIDAWSARMEYILTNTLLALLEFGNSSLLDINRMLGDDEFRKNRVKRLRDPVIKAFWEQEFAKYHLNFRIEAIAPIQNKVGQFIANPLIRNIIGQEKSSLDLRKVMDEKKIFLANLSKGLLGEESSMLLGGLLITTFQLAAMSRVDVEEEERKDFYLYIDEFQNFSTESFVGILSEARKYRLNLILAHQYLDQVIEEIMNSVFGNVGTFIVFKTGSIDAERFEKEYGDVYIDEFVNLPKYYAYVKLLVDGITSRPFLAITYPNPTIPEQTFENEIVKYSRLKYGENIDVIETRIASHYSKDIPDRERIVMYCENCHQEFATNKNNPSKVCQDCQSFKKDTGLSLKNIAEDTFIEPMKKERKPKEEIDQLKSLIKKLQKDD